MKLSTLNPKLVGDILTFDCPCGADHRMRVPLSEEQANQYGCYWIPSGEFPDTLTLDRSLDADCVFFDLVGGDIITVGTALWQNHST